MRIKNVKPAWVFIDILYLYSLLIGSALLFILALFLPLDLVLDGVFGDDFDRLLSEDTPSKIETIFFLMLSFLVFTYGFLKILNRKAEKPVTHMVMVVGLLIFINLSSFLWVRVDLIENIQNLVLIIGSAACAFGLDHWQKRKI